MTVRLAAAGRTAQAEGGLADYFDSTGMTIQIRTGAQPTDPDDAAAGTLCWTATASAPSFASASDDGDQTTAVIASIGPANVTAAFDFTSTPGHFRMLRGATVVGDGVIDGPTLAAGDIQLDGDSASIGLPILLSSITLVFGES